MVKTGTPLTRRRWFFIGGVTGVGMTDLLHWDFAEHFSGYDAAALILGLEPRESESEQGRIRVITERMELHYKSSLNRVFHSTFGNPLEPIYNDDCSRSQELASVKLAELDRRQRIFDDEKSLSYWLASPILTKFDMQDFARPSIANWLETIGMKSVYAFDKDLTPSNSSSTARWPWGDHHTELLGHLEAAARRYWLNYDPSDTGTAPTNAMVSEWLQRERKVSRTMADSIASMLRADGLPTGPRK